MCMIINVKTNRPKGEESARTDGLTDWQQVQAGRQAGSSWAGLKRQTMGRRIRELPRQPQAML